MLRPTITVAVATILSARATAQPCVWEPIADPPITIYTMTVYDDGSGPSLFAAGFAVGQDSVIRLAGQSWTPMGADSRPVGSMAVFDDGSGEKLYCGYSFADKIGRPLVHQWDGLRWSSVGGGIASSGFFLDVGILDLIVHDDGSEPALYAGGAFDGPNGFNVSHWRGIGIWEPVGPRSLAKVRTLAAFDDGSGRMLYASTNGRLQRWDGQWWTVLASANGSIGSLAAFDDGSGEMLYAAGDFTSIGGVAAPGLARWDGAAWSPVALSGTVWAIETANDGLGEALFFGGEFTSIGGVPVQNVARLTSGGFEALGTGLDAIATALRGFDNGSGPALYAACRDQSTPGSLVFRWQCQACYPDCDPSSGKGVLDIFDFLCFQDAFVQGDPYACDCDTPGVCDILDFLCFQDAFAAGCL